MIEFTCVQCGNRFRVPEEHAGRHGWCKVCKARVDVPMAPSIFAPTARQMDAEHLRLELDALQAARAELQTRLASAEQSAAHAESERVALIQRLEQAETERLRLKDELRDTSQGTGAAENALSEMRNEQERLHQTLELERRARQETSDALQALQAAHDEALAANAEMERAIRERQNAPERECDPASARLEELETALAKAEQHITALQAHVERMDAEMAQELDDAESLAFDTAESLRQLHELFPSRETFLVKAERRHTGDELPRFIPVTPASLDDEAARVPELANDPPPADQQAVAEAFLHFMQDH